MYLHITSIDDSNDDLRGEVDMQAAYPYAEEASRPAKVTVTMVKPSSSSSSSSSYRSAGMMSTSMSGSSYPKPFTSASSSSSMPPTPPPPPPPESPTHTETGIVAPALSQASFGAPPQDVFDTPDSLPPPPPPDTPDHVEEEGTSSGGGNYKDLAAVMGKRPVDFIAAGDLAASRYILTAVCPDELTV
jgi:hypothetical protein